MLLENLVARVHRQAPERSERQHGEGLGDRRVAQRREHEHDGQRVAPPRAGQQFGHRRGEVRGDHGESPDEQQGGDDPRQRSRSQGPMAQHRADENPETSSQDALDHDERHRESRPPGRLPAREEQRGERDRNEQEGGSEERREKHGDADREPDPSRTAGMRAGSAVAPARSRQARRRRRATPSLRR